MTKLVNLEPAQGTLGNHHGGIGRYFPARRVLNTMSSPTETQPSINSPSHMEAEYTNMGAELSTESQDDRPFREMMIASDLSGSVDDPDITIIRDYTSSMSSAVKVEITDANDAEFNYSTSAALRKCKKQVLQPYGRLLALVHCYRFFDI
ncbi:hypothetical protein Bbelb_113440 [Branchiostoma belcheri]|nr:hypothetical protein Bbelb_113440 [Branchiostoma belcheri]